MQDNKSPQNESQGYQNPYGKDISEVVKDMAKDLGASAVGIATLETLKDGPESTRIEAALNGAKSAIVFAVPFDQQLIEPYLSKKDFSLNQNKIRTTTLAGGIAFEIAGFLKMMGFEAVPVNTNFVYRKDTPNGIKDMKPQISHRYLAARSGVGFFGHSGHILTQEHGAAIALASVITNAELMATEPIPESENYCDDCNICAASCIPDFITPKDKTKVTMGGVQFQYGKKGDKSRCTYVCAGMSGLHPSQKWSTWSPARFDIPSKDEDFGPAALKTIPALLQRPKKQGVFYMPHLPGHVMEYSCSNCQFICHPDKNVRKNRFKLLTQSGVIIEDEKGERCAINPEDVEKHLNNLPDEKRKLYGEY